MKRLCFLFPFLLILNPLQAQIPALAPTADERHDVATAWRGVHYEIFHLERIAGNRLLVGIKVYATSDAASATFLGVDTPVPSNAGAQTTASSGSQPRPFSLAEAVLTDELSKKTYGTLKPNPADSYLPGEILATLHPHEGRMVTLQFPIPPPPPLPTDGSVPPKQTISIFLPNAQKAVTKLPLPPETATSGK